MHKISKFVLFAGLLGMLFTSALAWASPSVFPFGVTVRDQAQMMQGLTVFGGRDGRGYAVDAAGTVVNSWDSPIPNSTLGYTRPLPNGNVLALVRGVDNPAIVEMDQAGDVVMQLEHLTGRYDRWHHDMERLANGNTLILCSRLVTVPVISAIELQDDCIIEVDPAGNVLWEWQVAPHFFQLGLSAEAQANVAATGGDWAHANSISTILPNTLGDPRFKPGNVIMSLRHVNLVIVIDRPSGQVVWTADNVTIGQHNAYLIPPNLPGAGNIMIFDNGFSRVFNNLGEDVARPESHIVEIDPLTDVDTITYSASMSGFPNHQFFSHFAGGAQRLPNGNTLICEASNGRIFEVTDTGEIVWEYISPFFSGVTSQVYRAERTWYWGPGLPPQPE